MVSIGNVDLVMAALRARLQSLSKEKRTTRRGSAAPPSSDKPELRAIEFGNLQRLSPQEFDRAFVRVLLEREFGEAVAEDPRFLALAERTEALLQSDPDIQAMLRRVQQNEV